MEVGADLRRRPNALPRDRAAVTGHGHADHAAPRWWWIVLAGAAAIHLQWLLDTPGIAAGTAVAGVFLAGRAARRRTAPLGAWLVFLGLALGAVVLLASAVPAGRSVPSLGWVAAFAVAYLLFTAGMLAVMLLSTEAAPGATMIEAGIVAVGTMVVGWTVLVAPALHGGPPTAAQLAVAVTFNAVDLAMCGALIIVGFGWRRRGVVASMLLLAAGGAAVLASDLVFLTRMATIGTDPFAAGGTGQYGWLAWCFLTAAAVAHPSFGAVPGQGPRPPRRLSARRHAIFMAVAAATPVVAAAGAFTSGRASTPGATAAAIGPAALTSAVSVLLVARHALSMRLAEQTAKAVTVHAAMLDEYAAQLRRSLAEQQELQRRLAHQALHDPLTGLANRCLFTESLEAALAPPAGRPPPRGALLLVDLDRFKSVNDGFGHAAGDGLLVAVAARLRAAADGAGLVARLGGDEFAVLLTGVEPAHCRGVAAAIRTGVRSIRIADGTTRHTTASVGVLLFGDAPIPPAEAMRRADLALYAAKAAGRDRIVEFGPGLAEAARRAAGHPRNQLHVPAP